MRLRVLKTRGSVVGELESMGLKYVTGDIAQQEEVVRHDQKRLARFC